MSEEAPPVAAPVSEPQAPPKTLSPSQPSRTEESERPAERQPPLELPPEPCKVPLHIPMSNSMLESLPMTHISTTLAGQAWFFTGNEAFFASLCNLLGKPINISLFYSLFNIEVSAPLSTVQLPQQKPVEVPVVLNNPLPFPSNMMAPIGRPTTVPHDTDEDEGLHFEQVC